MFLLRSAFRSAGGRSLSNNIEKLSRCYGAPTDYEITFKPQFSPEENEKILDVLNTSNMEELKRYKIPQNRIKHIKSWRNKKGAFQSLNDILEVEGLSVKVLEKLCQTIINNSKEFPEKTATTADEENIFKFSKRQYLLPPVCENLHKLSTVVALHLAPMGISWIRLSKENHVDRWSFYGFQMLPNKILPADTFKLALHILNKLPPGDFYILEGSGNGGGSLQNGKSALLSTQQLELTSMLIALINTSCKHNKSLQNDGDTIKSVPNQVYFLKSKLPARLFGTLVGQERVSAIATITELLNNSEGTAARPYSAVTVDEGLKNLFLSHNAINKELLGQPLMLAITFLDICVKRNPAALKAVTFKGK